MSPAFQILAASVLGQRGLKTRNRLGATQADKVSKNPARQNPGEQQTQKLRRSRSRIRGRAESLSKLVNSLKHLRPTTTRSQSTVNYKTLSSYPARLAAR